MKKDKIIPGDLGDLRGDDPRFTSWHKPGGSSTNGSCVEVGVGHKEYDGFFVVRDTKNPTGPALAFTPNEWKAFVEGAKLGEFDA